MLTGLDASEAHPENGMTRSDMQACVRVANQIGEVIIFRSTGPWAKRWLQEGFPSKNFHVKGKSSNWGPQAGFVPYDGIYSKVGADPVKALKGTQANQHGLTHSEFAVKSVLNLTAEQIRIQGEEKAEGRLAIASRSPLPNGNIVMRAFRHGDNKAFTFLGKKLADGTYDI
ncbi:MAG: anthrax toxin-like adenylyl cyclase domain-containing protein, partial [Giesbergeria sp.]|nr:anthrax toxin-like adenylyl cyclase domain-containing protein [Giesbergeria sp.]